MIMTEIFNSFAASHPAGLAITAGVLGGVFFKYGLDFLTAAHVVYEQDDVTYDENLSCHGDSFRERLSSYFKGELPHPDRLIRSSQVKSTKITPDGHIVGSARLSKSSHYPL